MANEEHLSVLRRGSAARNRWRGANPGEWVDLRDADLRGANLEGADLRHVRLNGACLAGADLSGAVLDWAYLVRADLTEAVLFQADLLHANLSGASLTGCMLSAANLAGASLEDADLVGADLSWAYLGGADLPRADLRGADLSRASLVDANLRAAKLAGCRVYGASAWDVDLEGAAQSDLIITQEHQPTVTVDNLNVAQFVYLLLSNSQVRDVIDTVARKAVLILGRFTPERKPVLDVARDRLREMGYVPIMFDFEKPDSRNFIETVMTLAHLAKFIVADVTDAKVVLQEGQAIIPGLPSVPVQPIVQKGTVVNPVIIDFVGRDNFIHHLFAYRDIEDLRQSLRDKVIAPAEARLAEIERTRALVEEQLRRIACA